MNLQNCNEIWLLGLFCRFMGAESSVWFPSNQYLRREITPYILSYVGLIKSTNFAQEVNSVVTKGHPDYKSV